MVVSELHLMSYVYNVPIEGEIVFNAKDVIGIMFIRPVVLNTGDRIEINIIKQSEDVIEKQPAFVICPPSMKFNFEKGKLETPKEAN